MNLLFAAATTKVFGEAVTDPHLQIVSLVGALTMFIGGAALVFTTRMVDEDRIRSEPSISKLFGAGLPPRRILTALGRRTQTIGFAALVIGLALLIYVGFRNS
jgi:hypothetical protein